MKKIILSFFIILTFVSEGVALQALTFIKVQRGEIETAGIIAEESGKIFVEYLSQTLIRKKDSLQNFEGSMVAPEIVELPPTRPQSLMRPLFVFSLRGSSDSVLTFSDQYHWTFDKNRKKQIITEELNARIQEREEAFEQEQEEYRQSIPEIKEEYLERKRILNLEEETTETTIEDFAETESAPSTGNLYDNLEITETPQPLRNDAGVYVYVPFSEEEFRSPEIWLYNGDEEWIEIGGKITKSTEGDSVLSAKVEQTGTYGVFDSAPYPILIRGTVPEPIGTTQTDSPYPSVVPQEAETIEEANETGMVLEEGLFETEDTVPEVPLKPATIEGEESFYNFPNDYPNGYEPLDLSPYGVDPFFESTPSEYVIQDNAGDQETPDDSRVLIENERSSGDLFDDFNITEYNTYDVYTLDGQGIPSFEEAQNLITPETIEDNSYGENLQNNILEEDSKGSFPVFLLLSALLIIGGSILVRKELENS